MDDEELIISRRMTQNDPDTDEVGKYIIATGEFIQFTDDDFLDQAPDWHPAD